MKFYTVWQNNSGGYFIRNNAVDEYVCVQASSPQEAEDKLSKITIDYSDFCECCGERWGIWLNDGDGCEFIHDGYGNHIEDLKDGVFVIYFANGEKKKFNASSQEYVSLDNWI